jgi:hypothetical protein
LKEVNKFLNSEIMDEWIKKVPLEHLWIERIDQTNQQNITNTPIHICSDGVKP